MLLLAGMALLLAGCDTAGDEAAQDQPSSMRLSFWSAPTETIFPSIATSAVEEFERNNPGLSLDLRFTPDEEYKTRIAIEMATNDPPDIFMTWSAGFLEPFVRAEKVMDLTPYLEADPAWRDSFQPHTMDSLTFDGRIYAIPLSVSRVGLYYNKRLFREAGLAPPATLEDMEKAIAVLSAQGITPLAMGNEFPWVGGMFFGLLVNRLGGHAPYDAMVRGSGSWNDPAYIKAGEYLVRLRDMGAFSQDVNQQSYEEALELFTRGQAAMYLMGSWIIPRLVDGDSRIRDEVGIIPFPVLQGGPESQGDWMGQSDCNLGVSARCQDPAAAVRFLKLLTSGPYQIRYAQEMGGQPATFVDMDLLEVSPLTREFMDVSQGIGRLFLFYDVQFGPRLGKLYNQTVKDILEGREPGEAFEMLQQLSETQPAQAQ